MTMSSFRTQPRVGHLTRTKRVYAYQLKFKGFMIRFRVDEPDYADIPPIPEFDTYVLAI